MIHKLVDLGFSFNSLQPTIEKEIMEIHYAKHYAGYISALNKAIEDNKICENDSLVDIVKKIETLPTKIQSVFKNNAGGAYNHELFWDILLPGGSSSPENELLYDIKKTFGSMNDLISTMNDFGMKQFGSGWVWLVWNNGLEVCSTANQDSPLMGKEVSGCNGIPILGIDVWEHAYYLQYKNKRADYLASIWNVINWNRVEILYKKAKN